MPVVRAMCAIGQRGQLGLRGELPWEGDKAQVYRDDVARFFDTTRGHVILCGAKTAAAFPDFARRDRTVVEIHAAMAPRDMLARFPDRVICIGGGPPVWAVYAPFIQHWDITRLPYDGEADRFFDPAWLVAGNRL